MPDASLSEQYKNHASNADPFGGTLSFPWLCQVANPTAITTTHAVEALISWRDDTVRHHRACGVVYIKSLLQRSWNHPKGVAQWHPSPIIRQLDEYRAGTVCWEEAPRCLHDLSRGERLALKSGLKNACFLSLCSIEHFLTFDQLRPNKAPGRVSRCGPTNHRNCCGVSNDSTSTGRKLRNNLIDTNDKVFSLIVRVDTYGVNNLSPLLYEGCRSPWRGGVSNATCERASHWCCFSTVSEVMP